MAYWGARKRSGKRKNKVSAYKWSLYVSRLSDLTSVLGDVVTDIRCAFFALGPEETARLLVVYGEGYGDSAERYARETLPKWKSGATDLSGQTMERLVELVPPFLSASQRFGLLEKVLKKHPVYPPTINVSIDGGAPGIGLANLDKALADMRQTDPLAYLPPGVMKVATWLYAEDMTAARAMLAQLESRKNEVIRASAMRELDLLRRTVTSGQIKTASYSVKMPAGTLNVSVTTAEPSMWQRILG